MKAEAERSGRCICLKAGTQIWTQAGNDVIEFGGIEGYPESRYYPAVGVSYD
ncbi:hypothetical protein GCM10016234_34330 [Tianweitania populi]|uniref:Uncharacterized protein n=1 Tax=Tianweitania populi TaxID=1607949 RepID=A0A8J3GM09_9HYPH|nr:hypothetical protein GCM10016234_34330 [Tianweitania populi]